MKQIIILFILGLTACAAKLNTNQTEITLMDKIVQGKDIVIKGETITDRIDLIELLDSHQINEKSGFVDIHSNIYFEECIFEQAIVASKRLTNGGELITQFNGNVGFVNCKFQEEIDLRSSVFKGPVDFSNCSFKKGSNFQDALFMQRVTFNGAFWQDEAKFQQSRYYHMASFMDTRSSAHVLFQGALFHDECNFSVSEYSKYVDFSLARFNGKSTFNYVNWPDRVVLTNSVWRDHVSIVDGNFGSISFKGSRCDGKFLMQGEKVSGEHIAMDE